jgi:hypothetical protein
MVIREFIEHTFQFLLEAVLQIINVINVMRVQNNDISETS